MNRLALLLLVLCGPAHAFDTWTQAELDAFEAQDKCTIDPERFGIREPREEEILQYGTGIMVFEYYNSPAGCSETIEGQGIYYQDQRWGELRVQVGGKGDDDDERIWFYVRGVPYSQQVDLPLVIPDHWEPHIIILYPWIS